MLKTPIGDKYELKKVLKRLKTVKTPICYKYEKKLKRVKKKLKNVKKC